MKLIHFQKKYSGIIIAFILFLITVFVYTYKIDQITPGMFADEIAVGQMSEKLYKLPLTPFLPDNYGHPTPQLYIIGAVIKTFGRTVFNLRITSIIFAALSISIFYLLLRNYLNKTLSLLVSIMFMCSYPFIVVSRFAYEMSAAILFQILSLLFLIKYYKSKKIQDVVGFSFTISFGLYSYLSFRLTAIPLIIAMIALIVFNHMSFPRFTGMTILFSVILIITLPLNIYSFQHPDQVWARTNTISIFNQKFSPTEFRKELMANIARTYGTFINVPDPNPRQNPANTTPFDNITVLLIFTSLIIVFKKNKSFFIFIISLIFISLLGDILSIEKIPEFHYYGLGHPNTLRISSIIPIMYICIAIIFHYVFKKLPNKILGLSLLTCIAFIISAVHLNRYFNQPYLPYNYQVNGVKMLQLSEIINKTNVNHLILSSTILEDPRIQYFSQDKIKNAKIISNNTINDYKNNSSTMIIIDAPQNKELTQTFFTEGPQNGFQTYILKNPWNYPEAVILEKK